VTDFVDGEPSRIKPDGLRYKAKTSGTPFKTNAVGSSMSCLLCGRHTPRAEGAFKIMFGARQFVCFACRPSKA
jgi:hypothetical protein